MCSGRFFCTVPSGLNCPGGDGKLIEIKAFTLSQHGKVITICSILNSGHLAVGKRLSRAL